MSDRPLIVLSLEGLATAALGCYGSSWNQTPAIDAIAASGLVWDRCIANSDDPSEVLRGIIDPEAGSEAEILGGRRWADSWRQHGSVELLTDTPLNDLSRTCFDRVSTLQFARSNLPAVPAPEIDQSRLGQLFAAAIERDHSEQPWSVMWLHSSCLTCCWDAPRGLFTVDDSDDDGDAPPSDEVELLEVESESDQTALTAPPPPIFETVVPPQIRLDAQTHPDVVYSWMRTYGCQVRLLDLLIEVLLDSLHVPDPFVMIMGTSGFRLGQGGWIGHRPDRLRSPDIHLPVLLRADCPLRVPQVTSSSVLAEVLGAVGNGKPLYSSLYSPSSWSETGSDLSVETRSQQSQFAVTTAEWFCVRDHDGSEHLFLKPDDVDDFNDVGRIRDDVVDQLSGSKK